MKVPALVVSVALLAVALTVADDPPPRSVGYARHGMVAAEHPLAVAAGLEVLRKGGSAVDAAIAINAALGFLEPTSCGIGGDLMALVWDPKDGRLHGLNGSGRTPAALTIGRVPKEEDGTIPRYSPYAWTVPGAVVGWATLHAKFGRLPLGEVLAPAIALARDGAPVPRVIAAAWARGKTIFGDKPGFAQVFLPNGAAPREGEIFKNPALARTYEAIAAGGRDAYYKGAIATAIVAYSRANGGFFTPEDLAAHRSTWVDPASTTYRGVEVFELPPPGQGVIALEMLNMLEGFDLRAMGRGSPAFWHTMVEAKKLAVTVRFGVFEAFAQGARKTWELSVFTLKMLGRIVIGEASVKNISGPLTLADFAGQSAQAGILVFVGYLALISISLGVLNLLPVPLLDGGHLLYYFAEVVKGSPVSDRVFEVGQRIGMAMLAVLMALALFNDFSRLF